MLIKPLLIFTDLDGSLLNHDDYNYNAAAPWLKILEQYKVPVIPTTSKTYSELKLFRHKTNNNHPFIVENGAAIYIPKGYFKTQPDDTCTKGDYWVKENVQNRQHWQQLLNNLPKQYTEQFTSFANAGVQGIMDMTGLDKENAVLAAQREYGEPIQWHGDQEMLSSCLEILTSQGANTLKGGRFYHISGNCDKGQALKWLQQAYEHESKPKTYDTLSIGDSGNDIAMLEASHYACVVHSDKHSAPKLSEQNTVYYCQHAAPEGWIEGLEHILTIINKQD